MQLWLDAASAQCGCHLKPGRVLATCRTWPAPLQPMHVLEICPDSGTLRPQLNRDQRRPGKIAAAKSRAICHTHKPTQVITHSCCMASRLHPPPASTMHTSQNLLHATLPSSKAPMLPDRSCCPHRCTQPHTLKLSDTAPALYNSAMHQACTCWCCPLHAVTSQPWLTANS